MDAVIRGRGRIYATTRRKKDHEAGEIGGHVLGTPGGADTACEIREAAEIGYASDTEYADLAKLIMKLHPAIAFEEIIGKSENDNLVERFLGLLADQDDDHAAEPEEGMQSCSTGLPRIPRCASNA